MQEPFEIHPYRPDKTLAPPTETTRQFFYAKLIRLGQQWIRPKALICIGAAFMLGRAVVAGELSPFGLASMAVVVGRYRYLILPVFLALLLGQATAGLTSSLWLNGMVYISLVAVFPSLLGWVEGSLPLGIFTAIWAFGVKAGFLVMAREPLFYDFLMVGLEAVIGGALVPPLMLLLKGMHRGKQDFGKLQEEMASIVVLAFALLLGLNYEIYGYNLGVILSKYLIMLAALRGAGWGAVFGAGCGLVPGIASLNGLILAGLYAISGMLAGFLKIWGKIGLITGFFCGNLLYGFYFSDEAVLVDFLKTSGVAAALMLLTPKRAVQNLVNRWLAGEQDLPSPVLKQMEERLDRFAHLFKQLAVYYEQGAAAFEQEPAWDKLLNKTYQEVCQGCSLARFCWERDGHQSYRRLLDWAGKLAEEDGKGPGTGVPAELKNGCVKPEELALALNKFLAMEQVDAYWKEQLTRNRKGVATQLGVLAKALAAAKKQLNSTGTKQRDLEELLQQELEDTGFRPRRLEVWGEPQGELEILIELPACQVRKAQCIRKISDGLSRALDCAVALREYRCPAAPEEQHCHFHFLTIAGMMPEIGLAQLPKESGTVSGDAVLVTPLGGNRWCFILSDGMGSGEPARQESQTVVELMENLLSLEFDLAEAVRMVNTLLILNGEERFATMDLFILDLQQKKLEFVKIGAMPSILVQSGQCRVLESHSLPVGIVDEINIETMSLQLEPGTVLIMTTDGIWQGAPQEQEEGWLPAFVQGIWQLDAASVAQKIIEHGLILHGGEPQDDLTVLVVRIQQG